MPEISEIRPSPIAGRWYEGDPDRLASDVDSYIAEAQIPAIDGEVVALIAPHAGHIYSGRTAGHAFKTVQGQTRDLVAIVSPLHSYVQARALTSAHHAYQTPLGQVWIDQTALDALDKNLFQRVGWKLARVVYDQEHSLEIELPFLQRSLKGSFSLLPIMLRTQEEEDVRTVGFALADVLKGRQALLVASTDLSHFYPEKTANLLDNEMLSQIAAFSPEGALQAEREEKGFACGVAAVAAVLWAARQLGANAVEVLHHSTSADETGDRHSVVGYGAAVVLKKR